MLFRSPFVSLFAVALFMGLVSGLPLLQVTDTIAGRYHYSRTLSVFQENYITTLERLFDYSTVAFDKRKLSETTCGELFFQQGIEAGLVVGGSARGESTQTRRVRFNSDDAMAQ